MCKEQQNEIVRLRALLKTERRNARTDPLTGLGNRRSLAEMAAELEEAGETFAVLVFDAANLKAANTKLGHAGADELLRLIAKQIRASSDDRAFRTGGDEFCVVLPGVSSPFVAAEVRRRIERGVGVREIAEGVSFFLAGGEAVVMPGDRPTDGMALADRRAETRKETLKKARGEATTREAADAIVRA